MSWGCISHSVGNMVNNNVITVKWQMVTRHCGDHLAGHKSVESLCYTPETNTILYCMLVIPQ